MFVTVIDGRDEEMSLDKVVRDVKAFGKLGDEKRDRQVDVDINIKHVVISFTHYDMTDGDTHWIINRDDFVMDWTRMYPSDIKALLSI